ncbi:MAG: hypothetical protein IJC87_02865 [Clostridia bacterium]|nr:hypothetical protein [Clostridia bacterium]
MIVATMDFMVNATNVYRTKGFIVKQEIHIVADSSGASQEVSDDTYYKRTPEREIAYKTVYGKRKNKNGKRLPSTMYTRTYIE